ncbi:MAG: hypothetical protein ACREE9_20875, partial [Stellaceae bacterium]
PLFAAVFVAFQASPAVAQSPSGAAAPNHIRGTVEKLDGHDLTIKSRAGDTVSVTLAPNFSVLAVVPKTMADIKPGDFVASTSIRGPNGALDAIEVHILPQNLRSKIAGQFPSDLVPGSLMTNATVAQITSVPRGRVLSVTYKGRDAAITVLPGIPIVGYVPGDASLLKPGAAVFLTAQKDADGGLTAARVTAEKNGVKPPM